jgi:hypothetical protein
VRPKKDVIMKNLHKMIGHSRDVDEVARTLYGYAGDVAAPVTGALHLTCSDESEKECRDALQRNFAGHLLPRLKLGARSIFRIANLGARYEWGAVHIAEDHYSTAAARKHFKLMLVKVNAHVCAEESSDGIRFGRMKRYDSHSTYCGALHSYMDGGSLPFTTDLAEAFGSEGRDRLAVLLDDSRVPPECRSLFVAVASARIQARRAFIDIQDRQPSSPTLFIVMPCVTINRNRKDDELVCGIYSGDWRSDSPVFEYCGLGDDPAGYRLNRDTGGITVEDEEIAATRPARDHRKLVKRLWKENGGRGGAIGEAVELFAGGGAGIQHLHLAQRLALGGAGEDEARIILDMDNSE